MMVLPSPLGMFQRLSHFFLGFDKVDFGFRQDGFECVGRF